MCCSARKGTYESPWKLGCFKTSGLSRRFGVFCKKKDYISLFLPTHLSLFAFVSHKNMHLHRIAPSFIALLTHFDEWVNLAIIPCQRGNKSKDLATSPVRDQLARLSWKRTNPDLSTMTPGNASIHQSQRKAPICESLFISFLFHGEAFGFLNWETKTLHDILDANH